MHREDQVQHVVGKMCLELEGSREVAGERTVGGDVRRPCMRPLLGLGLLLRIK